MQSTGHIVYVSSDQGKLVVQHNNGFGFIELLGSEGEIQLGDIAKGNWENTGSELLYKDGEEFDAFFQGNWSSKDAAIRVVESRC